MQKQTQKIKYIISEIDPPISLEEDIFRCIETEENKQIKTRLFLTNLGLVGSFFAAFWVIIAFGNSFSRSEFWSIASLLFSDFLVVAENWKEYLFSLGETLPVVSLVMAMLPIFLFLLFANILTSFKNKYRHIHSHNKFIFAK